MAAMLLTAEAAGVAEAAELLRRGRTVAFPTETVYGLGGDATSSSAVAAIYAAKDRPSFNPLIAHVADLEAAEAVADLGPLSRRLAEAFWPGPLTIVAPRKPGGVCDLCAAGAPTVALRAPDHPAALALLRAFGGPLAGPSANPSGKLSPTSAQHVMEELSGRIAAVLDGGECRVGVESTIVAAQGETVRVLRPGGTPIENLEAVLGRPVAVAGPLEGGPASPGRLASHYAPRAKLRLNAQKARAGEAWLGFGPDHTPPPEIAASLSRRGDLTEAAANLFAAMRRLDALMGGEGVIAVASVPEIGLGRAINDRLRRAAAPR